MTDSNNHCGEKENKKRSSSEPGWRWGLAISYAQIQKDRSDTLTFERKCLKEMRERTMQVFDARAYQAQETKAGAPG